MATATGKARCVTCGKEKSAVRCEGCLQIFCFNHLTVHRQELSQQLDEIEINRDLFRQTLNEQTNDRQKHFLIKQINKWEKDSIEKIQQTAEECKQILRQHTIEHFNQIEINLAKLTDRLRVTRRDDDFNEIEINQLKQKLTQLTKELDQPSNISIQQDSTALINKISVVVFSSKCFNYI
jgi:hypothetical protein